MTLKSGPKVTYESFVAMDIDEDSSGNKKIKHAEEFVDANAYAEAFAPYVVAKA